MTHRHKCLNKSLHQHKTISLRRPYDLSILSLRDLLTVVTINLVSHNPQSVKQPIQLNHSIRHQSNPLDRTFTKPQDRKSCDSYIH
jgi:hypothetical protein